MASASKGKSALKIVQKYHPNVTKVVDARSPLHIAVTARDCKNSNSKEPSACAMARACEREFDGAIISTTVAYVIQGGTAKRYRVPQSVARELVSFDRNHEFAPGDYHLKAPSKCERLGPRTRPQPVKAKKYSNSKRRQHKTAGLCSL